MRSNWHNNDTSSPNHLLGQTSPYLLQHLYNPVDWHPWGDETILKAQKENKPLLISIGYSTCHWCHVMERESFEDKEVAELMNNNFICIKVDREERPDIDHIYMSAVQMISGQGGWPLNCFALPDGKPFWGGTYFRKEQWKSVLLQIAELFKTKHEELLKQAKSLTEGIASAGFINSGQSVKDFTVSQAEAVFQNIMGYMDKEKGGTLRAPKFPLPVNLEFLLLYYYFTGEKTAFDQVKLSLDKMAMGGIYDQIGGGFARYSTDNLWKVPHFEKMLYDNGQLISLYSNAWKVLKKTLYRDVVYQTVEFIEREMTSPEGVFYSALDADSDGEEGKFYVWQENEIDEIFGSDARLIKEYYQLGEKGYWENGNNILLRDVSDEEFSSKWNMPFEEFQKVIKNINMRLLSARAKRVRPSLDNKVIISWNALMIKGFTDAYTAFGDNSFLKKAKLAADVLIKNCITPEGKLARTMVEKKPFIDGFLEDYALFIQALIKLYEVSMNADYLFTAKLLNEYVLDNFSVPGTNLFSFSPMKGQETETPVYISYDGVISSSNSIMAVNLFSLSSYFEDQSLADRSSKMLSDMLNNVTQQSISYANWAYLLLLNIYPYYTLAVCGADAKKSLNEITKKYLPNVLFSFSTDKDYDIPVLQDRFRAGQTWYYVCTRGYCKEPVTELGAALEQIR